MSPGGDTTMLKPGDEIVDTQGAQDLMGLMGSMINRSGRARSPRHAATPAKLIIVLAAAAVAAAAAVPPATGVTPMAERVVHLAALNKRNGQTQEFTAHPGDTLRFATLTVRVRACETTPPWEARQTAAYLQIDDTPAQVRTACGGAVAARLFGLDVRRKPVAQPARTPALRRLGKKLHDALPRNRTGHGRRGAVSDVPVEGREIARRARGGGRASPCSARAAPRPSPNLREVVGQELGVEQPEPADAQPRDQRRQRAFRRVGDAGEHALAEERRAELDPVQPADEFAVPPSIRSSARCPARAARDRRRRSSD